MSGRGPWDASLERGLAGQDPNRLGKVVDEDLAVAVANEAYWSTVSLPVGEEADAAAVFLTIEPEYGHNSALVVASAGAACLGGS